MPDDETVTARPPAVSPTSILGDLAARREERAKKLVEVFPVPRWENPRIFVRYKIIDHEFIRTRLEEVDKAKAREKGKVEMNVNCDILAAACVDVFAKLDGDDTEYSLKPGDPEGDKTGFDSDLARNLGLDEAATARQIIRKLFYTDADILSTAGAVMDFVGYKREQIESELSGE